MQNISYRLYIGLTIALLSIAPLAANAQVTGVESLITAGSNDATALTKEYFRPFSSGLGAGLNSGWQNSAKPHSRYGFDIQVRGAFARVPSGGRAFDISDLNLERTRASNAENTESPTLSGNDQLGPEVIVDDQDGDSLTSFNLPGGTGLNSVPAPEVQISVGLIKDTDVMVRFVPRISLGDFGNYMQYGAGAKHDITGSLPGGSSLPVDLSLLVGYNHVSITNDLDVRPEDDTFPAQEYENQELSVGFNTFSVKALVGKSFPFVTAYGGIGYEFSAMTVDVNGEYPVPARGTLGGTSYENTTDPISYSQNGDNDLSVMAGVKIKLGLLDVFADYTLANYSVANAGIGISFR